MEALEEVTTTRWLAKSRGMTDLLRHIVPPETGLRAIQHAPIAHRKRRIHKGLWILGPYGSNIAAWPLEAVAEVFMLPSA